MLIVTGGIACGKSTFTKVARELELSCIDADEWYKDIYLNSQEYKDIFIELFSPESSLYNVAFKHENWGSYLYKVRESFHSYLLSNPLPDILVRENITHIPEELKYFTRLMIDREDNLRYCLFRDKTRDVELTKLIYKSQLTREFRKHKVDFILENNGIKQQFEEDCRLWLKSHLQGALTLHTKGINT